MAAPLIRVDYQQLEDIARAFDDQFQIIDSMLKTVRQQTDSFRNNWTGYNATPFFDEMDDEILPACLRLGQAMQKSSDTILEICRVFSDGEEEAAACFQDGGGETQSGKKIGDIKVTGTHVLSGQLFVQDSGEGHAVHPSDVNQDALGDCYFVAALASVAKQNPDLIKNNIQDNGDGTYTVTLYEKKTSWELGFPPTQKTTFEKHTEVVTAEFPQGEWTDPKGNVYKVDAHAGFENNQKEMWPLLMEKAYAQWQGDGNLIKGYAEISGGHTDQALEAITGNASKVYDADDLSITKLAELNKQGHAITLDTRGDRWLDEYIPSKFKDGILIKSHTYYLTDVDTANKQVTIRNPHGWDKGEIKLPFSALDGHFDDINVNAARTK